MATSSHALLKVLSDNGIDRVFLVPGESYLGVLDALNDFPEIDVVTCRHEGGASFMACADGRLTHRPGVVMVSRGPGATNASIGLHTAQQDGIPFILIIGQVAKAHLRKEAFQEIDYQKMFSPIAKWVVEVTEPEELAQAAFKAIRIATSGTPGPVVLVVPEDIQQQEVPLPTWEVVRHAQTAASSESMHQAARLLNESKRPLIVAGGALDTLSGRQALQTLAEKCHIPVAVSFRQHDIFPNDHALFVGDLGLSNPRDQIEAFEKSDLIIALGTRFGDITSQGYTFPKLPRPDQPFIHVYPDSRQIGLHFSADLGLDCDPERFALDLAAAALPQSHLAARKQWAETLNAIHQRIARFSSVEVDDGVPFAAVVEKLTHMASPDTIICLDAGTFAAPIYRHFPFVYPQRLMSPLAGAMGYGTPAAVASKLRCPEQPVICMVGDGGFLMTGNEMIAAVQRQLPILFILSNNNCYGSIRIHQDISYSDREPVGTTLSNPDFVALARAFGVEAERVDRVEHVEAALRRGLDAQRPYFIEINTSLAATLPSRRKPAPNA